MSDRRLRELERRWHESGSTQDRRAYEAARRRAGLPRLVVRHYIHPDAHGVVGEGGKIDARLVATGTHTSYTRLVYSLCGVELFPRAHGTFRKNCYYTESTNEVTCKTCLRSLNKPEKRVRYRTHYAPGCMGDSAPVPVCRRDDSEKFKQNYSHTMVDVNCPVCHRIMRKGARLPRRPSAGAMNDTSPTCLGNGWSGSGASRSQRR